MYNKQNKIKYAKRSIYLKKTACIICEFNKSPCMLYHCTRLKSVLNNTKRNSQTYSVKYNSSLKMWDKCQRKQNTLFCKSHKHTKKNSVIRNKKKKDNKC